MIETHGLKKAFGLRPVLRGVDLEIASGECVALLGPNGAGKTTLMRILATLSKPSAGQVRVAGIPLPEGAADVRRRLGVVSHHTLLYSDLTAEENLQFYARLYGLEQPAARLGAVLAQVGLSKRRRDLVRTFSRGMQQRLAIARALLPDPAVMLFDEPYTGLDPEAALMLDEVLRAVADAGRTVLLSTHDLPRSLALADRVMILARGVLAYSAATAMLSPAAFADTYTAVAQGASYAA
ncbi:MAG: heme ABC exporter ATP-binding protein CcmA [Anaerolineales bacterium]|nr:heme ABC exporter ATP-binding protein CcmA [Anaerolineales bacterium]